MRGKKKCPDCGTEVPNGTNKCPGPENGSCGHDWGAVRAAARAAEAEAAAARALKSKRRRAKDPENEGIPPQKPLADCCSAEQRARSRDAKAASRVQQAATLVTCCGYGGCGETKRADEFSHTERKKPAPRCIDCLASRTVKVPFDVSIRAADGTDMATIEASDDANERRWKVVAIGTVDNVDDEPEAARTARACEALRDAIGRNGSAHANVVRVDDVPTDYSIGVKFTEDGAGFYATEEVVRQSIAATEGGTRAPPRYDGTQERRFNDDHCDFERAARDLFDPARSRLALAATLRHLRGELPKPGDDEFYLFATKSQWPSEFDKDLPDMKRDLFLATCAVPGPGEIRWTHYGGTAEEVAEKCLRQGRCNIIAQVYGVTDEALFAQIAARSVEKLAALNLGDGVYTEDLLANVKSARAGLPFDVAVKDKDTDWKSRRLLGASMAAAGVTYVRGDGGGFVYRTLGPNPRDFLNLKDAMAYALEDSPTLMRLQRDAMLKKGYLEELLDAIVVSGVELSESVASRRDRASRRTGDVPTHLSVSTQASKKRKKRSKASTSSGSNSRVPFENCTKIISKVMERLAALGPVEGVHLVASDGMQLRPTQVGYDYNEKTAHPKAKALYNRAVQEVGVLTFDQGEVLRVFNRLATEDGYLTEVLHDTYKGKLNEKQYSFLSKHVVFAATFPHDIAPMESIRLMPKALAKFTRAFPGYWTKTDCQWNSFCYNIAVHHFNFAILHEETRRELPDEMEC